MTRLKVLHFVTNSCRYDNFCIIAGNTDRNRFDITVASIAAEGELQEDIRSYNIESFGLGFSKRSQYPQAVLKLAHWLKKNQIDIIQTHLYDASLVGLAAANLARTPLKILTGHHSHEMPFYRGKPAFWGDFIASRFLADYIIAPSEQMKEIFIEHEGVSADKIAVVHHGFDFSNWKHSEAGRARIRKEFELDSKMVFGAVGKIFWIKDYPMLLQAFAPVAVKFADAVLMIVGSGDQTDLRRLARELSIKENQIIFTGWRTDVPDLFSAIDVFVHSSLAESFGMVIIEAMAMGKPFVCTDVGIAREIIKDGVNGFLAVPGDQKSFAAALENIIQLRDEWSTIGKTNAQRVQEFTASKMVAGYENCYLKWYKSKVSNYS